MDIYIYIYIFVGGHPLRHDAREVPGLVPGRRGRGAAASSLYYIRDTIYEILYTMYHILCTIYYMLCTNFNLRIFIYLDSKPNYKFLIPSNFHTPKLYTWMDTVPRRRCGGSSTPTVWSSSRWTAVASSRCTPDYYVEYIYSG